MLTLLAASFSFRRPARAKWHYLLLSTTVKRWNCSEVKISGSRIHAHSPNTATFATTTNTDESMTTAMVRSLYRQCLQSAKRIPNRTQREMYWLYVKKGFRDEPRSSEEGVQRAIRNAQEQLDRMNYYHDMAALSRQEKKESGTSAAANVKIRHSDKQPRNLQTNADTEVDNQQEERDRVEVVAEWLSNDLFHPQDVQSYAKSLVALGFDTLPLLETELTEDDLQQFMKPAHVRVLVRIKGIASSSSSGHSP